MSVGPFAKRGLDEALGLAVGLGGVGLGADVLEAERFIQTALREWAYAQAYPTSARRAAELPFWLHRYNWHRPHGGIKSQTPISRLGLDQDNLLRHHTWSLMTSD